MKHRPWTRRTLTLAAALAAAIHAAPARAELSAEQLAKLAQNPIANLISVPFQYSTDFDTGPLSGTRNILNIQPVIPATLNRDWNLITRTIVPLIWQPEFLPGHGAPSAWATSRSRPRPRRPIPGPAG